VAQFICAAKSSLPCSMSTAMTDEAPDALAREQASRVQAPAPRTRMRAPGVRCARRKAWRTTERGSASAARGRSSVGGSLHRQHGAGGVWDVGKDAVREQKHLKEQMGYSIAGR
jgi:hypothetical protein